MRADSVASLISNEFTPENPEHEPTDSHPLGDESARRPVGTPTDAHEPSGKHFDFDDNPEFDAKFNAWFDSEGSGRVESPSQPSTVEHSTAQGNTVERNTAQGNADERNADEANELDRYTENLGTEHLGTEHPNRDDLGTELPHTDDTPSPVPSSGPGSDSSTDSDNRAEDGEDAGDDADDSPPRSLLSLPAMLVATLSVLAFIYSCRVVFPHHRAFGSAGFDYGLFDQGMHLMSKFKAPFVTIMGRNLFADHGSFTLLPFVPLYWLFNSGLVLYGAQNASIAFSAIPIYGAARSVLNDRKWLAAAVAVAYLCNPVLWWTAGENFHPDSLGLFGLALAWWALTNRRWRWFIAACLWVALTKEDMCLVVVPIGLYCAWRENRRVGLLVAGSSVGITALTLVLLRVMNGVGSLNGWRIPFGGPQGTIREFFKNPGSVFEYFQTDGRPWYLWQLAIPLFFAAAISFKRSLPVLGGSFMVVAWNMVSTFYYQHNAKYHYSGIIMPGLAIAAAFGLSRVNFSEVSRTVSTGLVLALSVWVGYLWGPLPVSRFPYPWSQASAATDATRTLLDFVPKDAVIAADFRVIAYLGHRKEAYQFPVPWKDSYWHLPTDETGSPDLQRRAARVQYLILPLLLDPEPAGVFGLIQDQFKIIRESPSGWAIYQRVKPGVNIGVPGIGSAPGTPPSVAVAPPPAVTVPPSVAVIAPAPDAGEPKIGATIPIPIS